jgi:hypothetical protein
MNNEEPSQGGHPYVVGPGSLNKPEETATLAFQATGLKNNRHDTYRTPFKSNTFFPSRPRALVCWPTELGLESKARRVVRVSSRVASYKQSMFTRHHTPPPAWKDGYFAHESP